MRDKVMKFGATWCSPCKMLSNQLAGVDLGADLEEIDVDCNHEIAGQYAIRGIPTLVYVRGGTEVSRLVGAKTADDVRRWVATL
jgi:thioredoxin 1